MFSNIKNITLNLNNNFNNNKNYFKIEFNNIDEKKFENILQKLSDVKPNIIENKIYEYKNNFMYAYKDGIIKSNFIRILNYNKIDGNINLILFLKREQSIDNFQCHTNYDNIFKQHIIIFTLDDIKIKMFIKTDEEKNIFYTGELHFGNKSNMNTIEKYYNILH